MGLQFDGIMKLFSIKKATPSHIPEVAFALRASFDATYPTFPALHTPEEDVKFISDVVFEKDEVYVAEELDSGKVVGFIAFNKEFVDHLYFLPEAQRRGLGSQLLELAKHQSNHLRLWTFQENLGARAFYEKHGFRAVRFTDGEENDEKQPDVLYEWVRSS